jgi:hypothetical protein
MPVSLMSFSYIQTNGPGDSTVENFLANHLKSVRYVDEDTPVLASFHACMPTMQFSMAS